ncbi:unnamed protein product [Adineta steineri]|uniref:G domain-containing protein n=1 Tax=Adineta steineri TaxID=433720 RepID=A0A819YYB0_9BILA|nr:unnamed protein product [Adineta steineri]
MLNAMDVFDNRTRLINISWFPVIPFAAQAAGFLLNAMNRVICEPLGVAESTGRFENEHRATNTGLDELRKNTIIKLAQQAKPLGLEGNHVALFGTTSCGKSTMLNVLYGKKVAETGFGETTREIKSYQANDFVLWDIPGKNDEVSYMSMQYISFFKGLTRRIILVTNTLKESSSMMKLLDAIGLDYDIVVNKMDQCKKEEEAKFREAIETEKQTLGLQGVRSIFYISAENPTQFPDWLKMVDYLTGR